ncbi:MAG: hypothetical protein HY646_03435, partial [Acidobacteria bacterium]|nr:hypothetical protein [Acidobacteriota bacterium]
MNEGTNPISVTAESLRRAFDESFASAYPFEQHLYEVFIAIRAAGNPYAIRLKEISGLFTRKEIT